MRMGPYRWEMTEYEAQIVAQMFLNFLNYRIGRPAVNAFEVSILKQRHWCIWHAPHVIALADGILKSNRFCSHQNNPFLELVDQAVRTEVRAGSIRNLITARIVSAMKSTSTRSCVNWNGGSDCVGASAFSAGTFWNSWTINTKTLR